VLAVNVLHVSAECYPFVKIGGLADVVGSLPGELGKQKDMDVRVILPRYKSIPAKYLENAKTIAEYTVNLGDKSLIYAGIMMLQGDNVTYYFIDNLFYFGSREEVYNYGDEAERYAFFQIAVLEGMTKIGFSPDIVHVHDWHTGMIPLLLKTKYSDKFDCKSVLTIHNLAYQGIFPLTDAELFGFGYDYRFEYEGFLNFLKSGIVCSDLITTVSPTYAKEIMTDYYGYGMQRLLKARAGDVKGILNGIDMKEFNPVTDKLIAEKYGIDDYREGKIANRKALEDAITAHLPAGRPLVGIVSRLVSQKGIDLIKRVFDEMLETDDFSCVVLGSGQAEYEDYFKKLALDHPDRVFVRIGYDNKLAHLIYAASDIFLMPSKFEPCGLGQMIAMRYGSIPVVRETGGLSDTIQPFNEYVPSGNGFSFTNFNAHDMMHVLRYAFRLYRLQGVWNYLVKEAMSVDFSWQKSAKEYKKVYKQLLKNKEETI